MSNNALYLVKKVEGLCISQNTECTVVDGSVMYTNDSGSITVEYVLKLLASEDEQKLMLTMIALITNNTFTGIDTGYIIDRLSANIGNRKSHLVFCTSTLIFYYPSSKQFLREIIDWTLIICLSVRADSLKSIQQNVFKVYTLFEGVIPMDYCMDPCMSNFN